MYNMMNLFHSVFPAECLLCGLKFHQISVPDEYFCRRCRPTLPYITTACRVCAAVITRTGVCGRCLSSPPYFDASLSVFEFAQPISEIIHKFKYRQQFHLGKILSVELGRTILSLDEPLPEMIIPVPLHKKRLRQRGYNQSAMIARHLSKILKIPHKNNYLSRKKYSPPQIQLSAAQRRRAVSNAFVTNLPRRYRRIALVDDVVTTTHTANQAAKALKRAGNNHVTVWSLARNT